MKSVTFNNGSIDMAANLRLPAGFDEKKTYPAIVVTPPTGGVKEQTAGPLSPCRQQGQASAYRSGWKRMSACTTSPIW